MFNNFLNELGYLPAGQAYMDALQTILKPLEERWPDAVSAAINAAKAGNSLEAVGQILCDALRTWEMQIEEKAAEIAQVNSQKVSELEQRLKELEFSAKQKDESLSGMQELLNNRSRTIGEMAEKLHAQNVVIADQYQKLSGVFGDADNSHDTQKLLS